MPRNARVTSLNSIECISWPSLYHCQFPYHFTQFPVSFIQLSQLWQGGGGGGEGAVSLGCSMRWLSTIYFRLVRSRSAADSKSFTLRRHIMDQICCLTFLLSGQCSGAGCAVCSTHNQKHSPSLISHIRSEDYCGQSEDSCRLRSRRDATFGQLLFLESLWTHSLVNNHKESRIRSSRRSPA